MAQGRKQGTCDAGLQFAGNAVTFKIVMCRVATTRKCYWSPF